MSDVMSVRLHLSGVGIRRVLVAAVDCLDVELDRLGGGSGATIASRASVLARSPVVDRRGWLNSTTCSPLASRWEHTSAGRTGLEGHRRAGEYRSATAGLSMV